MTILAGDIGGTKTVLALYRETARRLEQVREETFKSQEFPRFELILDRFLSAKGHAPVKTICLGVAGPIRNGQCRTTNLPWYLDERSLADAFGVRKVKLLNDLQAMAYGTLFLTENELAVINHGNPPREKGTLAVIAAGTGLGESILCWDAERYLPVASEGGHTDFAPQNEREIALLRFLQSEFGHVSYERVLSGPGLYNVYRFLRDTGYAAEPDWLRMKLQQGDPSVTITEIGLANGHELCTETLRLFISIYGAEAGNLALKAMASSGIYIGGGIALKILDRLRDGTFMQRFTDKGRYADLMKEIPVKVILNDRVALTGAAYYALHT